MVKLAFSSVKTWHCWMLAFLGVHLAPETRINLLPLLALASHSESQHGLRVDLQALMLQGYRPYQRHHRRRSLQSVS